MRARQNKSDMNKEDKIKIGASVASGMVAGAALADAVIDTILDTPEDEDNKLALSEDTTDEDLVIFEDAEQNDILIFDNAEDASDMEFSMADNSDDSDNIEFETEDLINSDFDNEGSMGIDYNLNEDDFIACKGDESSLAFDDMNEESDYVNNANINDFI